MENRQPRRPGQGNPREEREANARFEYDIRNHGVNYAVDQMFARNAARRESERRDAVRAMRDSIEEQATRNLRELYRKQANSAKE